MDLFFQFSLECILMKKQLQQLSITVIVKPRGRPLQYITQEERKYAIKMRKKMCEK